jgi:multiple sugar transport system substrate-binding protein
VSVSLLVAVLAGTATSACGAGTPSGPVTLNWYIFKEPSGAFAAAARECSAGSHGAYQISINLLPNDSDGQRQQMVRRLAAEDSQMDIMGLDVTWTAEFAEAGWVAPIDPAATAKITDGVLPAAVDTATWKGRLYAAPLNSNVQLLWYRKDLVPTPPRTWDEMIAQATALARDGKPHFVEVQGAQYEGYTVLFNALVASAGGSVLSPDGTEVVLGEPAERAVQAIRALADSPAADPSWSNQREDDNRLAFETGAAAFQLNYPFIYPSALANNPELAENIGWTLWPSLVPGKAGRSAIGGINLAVSAYSRHQAEAVDAVTCLRGRDKQIRNAVDGGLPPTLEEVYRDPALVEGGYPFAAAIYGALQNASVRPKTPAYQSVSLQISGMLSPPSGISLDKLGPLRSAISDALESKGLVP